ncbi:MAG: hypothetical protein JWQ25_2373 [Daejeonella sp.]|nr:hypothetical protein [Daejeonella sp.]
MAITDFTPFFRPFYNRPSVTVWNRLDSYPRSNDFSRGLKAEVRDAMWMLTRQWQFGEFKGEDGGSPIFAKVSGFHRTPDTAIVNGLESPYQATIPLEAVVEQEEIPATLRLRIQMGQMLQRLLKNSGLNQAYPFFIKSFPLPDFSENEDLATRDFYQASFKSVADGYEIYKKFANKGNSFFEGADAANLDATAQKSFLEVVFPQFLNWFKKLYLQVPKNESAWQSQRMEYDFQLKVPSGSGQNTLLKASDYAGGRLEWTDFDLQEQNNMVLSAPQPVPGEQKSDVFLPSIVTFKGMPNPRFWQMEAGNMDFGKIEKSPAGIVGLLLAEYGLTYSNDWFLLPYPLKINTLCSIAGILVTDVFGQKNLVSPSRMTNETNWQELSLFSLSNGKQSRTSKQVFYLPPVTGATQESKPLERVFFMRDEMANLVWAIEDIIPSELGIGEKVLMKVPEALPQSPEEGKWTYTLGTTVPDHWIPFVAVHKTGSDQEIHLQRARMPNAKPASGVLLTENQPVHFLESQEVPRAGVIVERTMQRVRWLNGQTFTWIGRKKTVGRGEGSSELVFDKIH